MPREIHIDADKLLADDLETLETNRSITSIYDILDRAVPGGWRSQGYTLAEAYAAVEQLTKAFTETANPNA